MTDQEQFLRPRFRFEVVAELTSRPMSPKTKRRPCVKHMVLATDKDEAFERVRKAYSKEPCKRVSVTWLDRRQKEPEAAA